MFKSFKGVSRKTTNPYTKDGIGNRATDDRYMNLALSKKNWQLAFAAILIANVIMAFQLGYVAVHSKVETRVALVNDGTVLKTVSTEELGASQKTRLITEFLRQFIINARLVSSDEVLQKHALDQVYASVNDPVKSYLDEWYDRNNPLNLAASYTVSVDIINALEQSPTTMQITWDETRRSVTDGAVLGTTRWYGQLGYEMSETGVNKNNPFGIYINKLNWSQGQ